MSWKWKEVSQRIQKALIRAKVQGKGGGQMNPCPLARKHTKQPDSYSKWHSWAEKKSKTHYQSACPACGRFVMWRKRGHLDFGRAMATKRAQLKMSLRDVAKRVGVSLTTIKKAEKGADIKLSTAARIAEILGMLITVDPNVWREGGRK